MLGHSQWKRRATARARGLGGVTGVPGHHRAERLLEGTLVLWCIAYTARFPVYQVRVMQAGTLIVLVAILPIGC
ncbi:hypothetical protein [Pseudomonas mosselii]|uniref:hypothetical protein n=1 Tax=Pseudomonas mosselii TaxID=78327 RepID=UPI003F410ADC